VLPESTIRPDTDALNSRFPRWPITVTDKGWVYGVWYCGTPRRPAVLHGQYPSTFLARALALFPEAGCVLHVPSGSVSRAPGQITVDRVVDNVRRPAIQADAAALPFADRSFDLILADPPYSAADATRYGCSPWPQQAAMREFHRLLVPGGWLGYLHTAYPAYRRDRWKLGGLIAVVTGFQRATRIFALLRRLPSRKEEPRLFRLPPRKRNGARGLLDPAEAAR
jgi:SAM-dependent methyltransferase